MSGASTTKEQVDAVAIIESALHLREVRARSSHLGEMALDAMLRRRGDAEYRKDLAARHRAAQAEARRQEEELEARLTRWSQDYRPALWR